MEFELRAATEGDREFLYAVHRAAMGEYVARTWGAWDEAWQRAHFEARFDPRRWQVISRGGRAVGQLALEERAGELYVAALALAPAAQGAGLGSAVLRAVLARADARGAPVALQVLKANAGARRLYERLGFRAVDETTTHVRLRRDPSASERAGRRGVGAAEQQGYYRTPEGEYRAASSVMNRPSVFVHILTVVHALGALACFAISAGSATSTRFRESLAVSGGSTVMVQAFGGATWVFLLCVGLVLATLAYASWRVRPWAWHLTLLVYGIGVAGSLWQVSVGIEQGWISAVINAAVVAYACTPTVRRAYAA